MERNIYKIGKELFITNDEEIKEGDYITDGYRVWKWKDDSSLLGRKKIILTTDQDLIKDSIQAISDEFIELFVKNSSCEEVEVDIMNKGYNKKEDIPYQEFYKIIIPQEEPKIDSIFNEANVRFSETLDKLSDNSLKQETIEEPDYNKIIEQSLVELRKQPMSFVPDKIMYSEEEVRTAIFKSFLLGVDRNFYSKEIEDKIIQHLKKK